MLEYRKRRDPSSLTYRGWCALSPAKLTVLDCCTLPTCAAPRCSACYDVLVLIASCISSTGRDSIARVVVLPPTLQSGCNCHLHKSLTYTQREVDIGFNAVRTKDATVVGAHVVEPIKSPYRANTELNASTDARHALVGARGMHAALPAVPCTWNCRGSWSQVDHNSCTVPPSIPATRYDVTILSNVGSRSDARQL